MMDHSRFDAWVKAASTQVARRALLAALAGVAARGLPDAAEARKRKHKRRKKGKSACPRGQKRCAGVCQECCTVLDCRATTQTDGLACEAGRCVCPIAGTRRCPANTAWAQFCGHCCDNSDCPGIVAGCGVFISGPPTCDCGTNVFCDQVCVHFDCEGKCALTCNVPGQPAAGQACCLDGALTCLPAPEQGDPAKHRCLPI